MFQSLFQRRYINRRRGKANERESLLIAKEEKSELATPQKVYSLNSVDDDVTEATLDSYDNKFTTFTFEDGTTEATPKTSTISSYNLTAFTFADGTTEVTSDHLSRCFNFEGETMESTTNNSNGKQSFGSRSFNITPKSAVGFSKLIQKENEFAKQSLTMKRSNLGYLEGDGDVWVEVPIRSRKTGVVRSYFISVETGERRRDEPPTGASRVIYLP